ncbi:TPA: hypothetical protein DEA21_02490 [Candidatus Uhrbacteria bacterium]|nr:hypothetical protein [Candidatus Uhrbacteria bacterium]HCU31521.1 hypothetical protein [Candidatus Uhrbacteria bacterium]
MKVLGGNLEDKDFIKKTTFIFCRAFNYRGGGSGTGGHIIRAAETLLGFPFGSLEEEFKKL